MMAGSTAMTMVRLAVAPAASLIVMVGLKVLAMVGVPENLIRLPLM